MAPEDAQTPSAVSPLCPLNSVKQRKDNHHLVKSSWNRDRASLIPCSRSLGVRTLYVSFASEALFMVTVSQSPSTKVPCPRALHCKTLPLQVSSTYREVTKTMCQQTVCQTVTYRTAQWESEDVSHEVVIPRPYLNISAHPYVA